MERQLNKEQKESYHKDISEIRTDFEIIPYSFPLFSNQGTFSETPEIPKT